MDQDKVMALDENQKATIDNISKAAKKNALATVAVFPAIMFVCFVGLILYFRSKGGYTTIDLESEAMPEAPD